MSQISLREAVDLLQKFASERIPLRAMLASPSGARAVVPGFVDSFRRETGLVVSVSGPPIDVFRGYIAVRPFDRPCDFTYGEERELPEEVRQSLSPEHGKSVLVIRFLDSGEVFALFFTI